MAKDSIEIIINQESIKTILSNIEKTVDKAIRPLVKRIRDLEEKLGIAPQGKD